MLVEPGHHVDERVGLGVDGVDRVIVLRVDEQSDNRHTHTRRHNTHIVTTHTVTTHTYEYY